MKHKKKFNVKKITIWQNFAFTKTLNQIGNHPYEDLIKFGYNGDMKIIEFKTSLYIFGS